MSRVCFFTGKRTRSGRSIARKGKAKYLGGVGRKTTGVTKRKFKPNIQRVRAVVDGTVCRIKVSAKAIKMGLVVKPPKRNYKPAEAATAKAQSQQILSFLRVPRSSGLYRSPPAVHRLFGKGRVS